MNSFCFPNILTVSNDFQVDSLGLDQAGWADRCGSMLSIYAQKEHFHIMWVIFLLHKVPSFESLSPFHHQCKTNLAKKAHLNLLLTITRKSSCTILDLGATAGSDEEERVCGLH